MQIARKWLARLSMTVAVVVAGLLPEGGAVAQVGSDRYSSIVIDAGSGNVLSAVGPDETRYPASLTKVMTLYMAFEALRDRRISLNQAVPVSSSAASMPPSKLGLVPGSQLTVEQAILALVTKSANDAAAALGEFLGGDEDRFAQMMTLRAHALGMPRTTFRNASGLPDWNQVTTARDLAVLARRMISDFPGYYGYFSTPYFAYRGRTIYNHDRMLQSYAGADGLKTGYIDASGHNLITSATRGGVRLVGVVLGAGSNAERDIHMTALLDQGFDQSGVGPVFMARRAPSFPSLVASAQAAPLAFVPRPLAVQARPFRRAAEPSFRELAREARPSLLPRQRRAEPRAVAAEMPRRPAIQAVEPVSRPTLRAPARLRDGVRGATRGPGMRPYS